MVRGLKKHNLVYLTNHKVGSTFVIKHMWNISGQKLQTDLYNLESNPFENTLDCISRSRNAFVFTFVRNPFARALSVYNHKINADIGRRDAVTWASFYKSFGLSEDAKVSFDEFIELLSESDDLIYFNPHWRPQSINVLNSFVTPNFLGHVETMDEDFGQAMLAAGIDYAGFRTGAVNKGPSDTNRALKDALSNPLTVDRIAKLYGTDFEAYGYSTDPLAPTESSMTAVRTEGKHPALASLANLAVALDQRQFLPHDAQSEFELVAYRLCKALSGSDTNEDILSDIDEALRLLNTTTADTLKDLNRDLDQATRSLKAKTTDYDKMSQQLDHYKTNLDHCKRYPWKYLLDSIKLRLDGENT
nr:MULTISPECIES: sulfotransferase family 2 domain-containing protein [unclassified Ruegeria]